MIKFALNKFVSMKHVAATIANLRMKIVTLQAFC